MINGRGKKIKFFAFFIDFFPNILYDKDMNKKDLLVKINQR